MNTIEITRPTAKIIDTNKKKYWKSYMVFGTILGLCALLNVIASVESMYSSNNAQEFEFKKAEITAQIQELEKQRSIAANLNSIQALAVSEGYAPVSKLQYVNAPMSQKVAER